MQKLRIIHNTEYFYHEPVSFGPHRAMVRPREGHDLQILSGSLKVEPAAKISWQRDFQDNSVAVMQFSEPSDTLRVLGEVLVEVNDEEPAVCAVRPDAAQFPFVYPEAERVEMAPFLLPSYPHDVQALNEWLVGTYTPGEPVNTIQLLDQLNTRIFESFRYVRREEAGVQIPCETLAKGTGSCRDFAVFLMEAVRILQMPARFVTGYIQMGEGQHGATHAWTEVYLPGAGWLGYDPTNNKRAGLEHVTVGVSRLQETAAPLSGSWSGPAGAFDRMEVSVQVVAVK